MIEEKKNNLGKVVSVHPVGAFGLVYVSLGICLIVVSICAIFFAFKNQREEFYAGLVLLSIICFAVGSVVILRWAKYKNSFITVYERGIDYFVSGRSYNYLWDEIDYVAPRTQKPVHHGVVTPEEKTLKIKIKQGPKYSFSESLYQDFKVLGKLLQKKMLEERLPVDLKKIQQGETLKYGVLRVNNKGITRKFRTISWSEVEEVRITVERVIIKKKNRLLAWSRPFNFQMGNMPVFIEIAKIMMKINK